MGGKLPDMSGIEATEAIKEKDLFVQIVLLAVEPGTELMRKAMRARIRDVIPAPPEAETLYEALRAAHGHYLDLKSKATPPATPRETPVGKPIGDVIAIYSGKGGVGCTSIATNLAVKLHTEEKPTVVVDADLQQGDVALFLNLDPRYTIADLVPFDQETDKELLDQVLVQHGSGLRVLAAPKSLIQADSVSTDDFRGILAELRRQFGWIVVDTDSHLSDLTIAAIEVSDLTINVMTPDIPSIRASRNFHEVIKMLGIPEERTALVLNMVDHKHGISAGSIEENLKRQITSEIPFDRPALLEAVNRGEPIVLSGKSKPFTKGLYGLLERLRELIVAVKHEEAKIAN